MSATEPQAPRPRNLLTYRKHRRQVLWQITVPVLVGALILVALAGLAVAADASQTSQLADISLITLVIPAMIFGLIYVVLMLGSIFLLVRLIKELPFFTFRAQNFLALVELRVIRIGDALSEPFLRTHSFQASLRAFRRSLLWMFKPK
jgi:hypothetical protein